MGSEKEVKNFSSALDLMEDILERQIERFREEFEEEQAERLEELRDRIRKLEKIERRFDQLENEVRKREKKVEETVDKLKSEKIEAELEELREALNKIRGEISSIRESQEVSFDEKLKVGLEDIETRVREWEESNEERQEQITQRMESLENWIGSLNERGLVERINGLEGKIEALEVDLDSVFEEISEIDWKGDIEQVRFEMLQGRENFERQISSLNEILTSLKRKVSKLEKEGEKGGVVKEEVKARFEEIEKRMEETETRFEPLLSSIRSLESREASLEEGLSHLNSRVEGIMENLEYQGDLSQKVERLEVVLSELQSEGLKERLESLAGRVDSIEHLSSDVEQLKGFSSEIEQWLENVRENMETHDSEIGGLIKEVKNINSAVTELKSKDLKEVKESISNLNSKFEGVDQSVGKEIEFLNKFSRGLEAEVIEIRQRLEKKEKRLERSLEVLEKFREEEKEMFVEEKRKLRDILSYIKDKIFESEVSDKLSTIEKGTEILEVLSGLEKLKNEDIEKVEKEKEELERMISYLEDKGIEGEAIPQGGEIDQKLEKLRNRLEELK